MLFLVLLFFWDSEVYVLEFQENTEVMYYSMHVVRHREWLIWKTQSHLIQHSRVKMNTEKLQLKNGSKLNVEIENQHIKSTKLGNKIHLKLTNVSAAVIYLKNFCFTYTFTGKTMYF